MRKFKLTLLILMMPMLVFYFSAQGQKISPTTVKTPIGFAISKPLNENPIVTDVVLQTEEFYMNKHRDRKIDPNIVPPDFTRMPIDPNEQTQQGWIDNSSKALNLNFAGQNSGSYPPDCNGTVGPNHYFQVVNTTYAIYDKTGNLVAGPSALNSIFDSSLPGAGYNDGDPIVLWDEHANRWFYAEFSLSGSNDYMLIAVSTTSDPTGTWYSWSFDVDDTPDYMKFGIWQDGYYMATNTSGGDDVYVFDRDAMIAGDTDPTMIGFDNPNRPSTFDGFHCIMPLDNDGAWAPTGTPGQFITIADDGQSNSADALYIYELDVDWNTPSNSTFARTQTLGVNSFSGNFTSDWNNIPQPGTSQKLDGISTVLMYRAQYRNFSGTEKIVCVHTIAESSTESALRWYELENTGSGWSIAQQGTYNPDGVSRWNASIAMNDLGQIAMGYSVSDGSSTYPGIRYCGQTSNAPSGVMDVSETNIWTGSYSQSSYNRWGDYANISIDPSDGETFWFTSEYKSSTSHGTRIAAFTIDESVSCTPPSTQASNFSTSSIGDNSMTVSWTRGSGNAVLLVAKAGSAVSSDPVSGTSYSASSVFGSGEQIGSGNYVLYKGTGSSVNVTGLSEATTYYFAVYEYNTSDNCYNITELSGSATTTGVTYCTSQGSNYSYEWISDVEIGDFSNSSGAAGYTDYTGTEIELNPGTSYDVSLTPGFSGSTYNEYWKIWIDYNKNGSFDDAGELVFDPGSMSKTTVTGTIDIASDASGSTRMRVSMKYNGEQTSCETFSYGEVEDYTVTFGTVTNIAPVAEANGPYSGTAGQSVSFSSTGSYDSDGSIASYYWEFGDGGTSTSANPTHTYSSAGSYSATLTVTDNGGLTDSDNASVSITAANVAPVAEANGPYSGVEGNAVSFSSSGSYDSDGSIASYYWQFGDGGTSSSANPTHTYSTAGSYTATLTVTDNGGLTDSDNATVTISAEANEAPTAEANGPYTGTEGQAVTFSSSGSYDSDGSIASYYWQFGDGVTSSSANPTHTYSTAGSYSATLTVTDNGGLTDSDNATVTIESDDPGDCYVSIVQLSLTFDNYPSETSWTLKDGSGNTLYSGSGYSTKGATITEDFDLDDGDYTFTINDSYGDGICCSYGNGSYTLTDDDGTVIVTGGDFGSSESTDFCISGSGGGGSGGTEMPTGYCSSSGNNSSYEWIDLVQLGSIDNTTGNDGGYADYTSLETDLVFGDEYTINFSCGFRSSSYTEYWHVFIDYNRDGDFEDSGEEVVTGSSSSSGTLSGTFTVPSSASEGYARMRVTMKYNASATSCETFTYGEVEDYAVYLTPTQRTRQSFVHENGFEIGFEDNMYTIYPNPATDQIHVRLPENSVVTITITDINGKVVSETKTENNNEINISSLHSGIYIIKIDDGRKTNVERFVKY